jgi:hypothetical protein
MTPRHITLATIATLLTIIGSVASGVITVKRYIDNEQAQSINRTLQREQHEQEIDRRISNLEMVVRSIASGESPRQRDLINQILAVKAQVQQISQKQNAPQVHRFDILGEGVPADAPAVRPPSLQPPPPR